MLLLPLSLESTEIDDDDNSTKSDAVLAAAQFHCNFPQFCATDNGARRNYLLSATAVARPGAEANRAEPWPSALESATVAQRGAPGVVSRYTGTA